ncbi:MAG: ATP-grasp fold amidoligase family protein, partial [Anderseniella sp.]
NDKYAWRKIFDRNPLFITAADKLKVKDYVARLHPNIKFPTTLWEGVSASEIPEQLLKGDVVVKANHGSGWNIFIRQGKYDRQNLLSETRRWLAIDYGRRNAEWPYRKIERKLFVEEMLFEDSKPLSNEYKFYCAGGEIVYTFVRQLAPDGTRIAAVVDETGKVYSGEFNFHQLSQQVTMPDEIDSLRAAANRLSADFDFVRCDLYLVDGKVYFSEFTLFTIGGFAKIESCELSEVYSGAWDIRKSWFLTTPQTSWRENYRKSLLRTLDMSGS